MTITDIDKQDWRIKYNEILHDWFKRVVTLELDTDFMNRVRGKGGFWTIKCQELEDMIDDLISQAKAEQREEILKKIEKLKTREPLPYGSRYKYYNKACDDIAKAIRNI